MDDYENSEQLKIDKESDRAIFNIIFINLLFLDYFRDGDNSNIINLV